MADQPNTTPATDPGATTTPADPPAATPPAAPPKTEPTPPATVQNIDPAQPPSGTQDHMIPKGRFDEINTKLKEAEKRLKEIEKAEAEAAKQRTEAEQKAAEEKGEYKRLYEEAKAAREADAKARAEAEAAKAAAELKALRIQIAAAAGLPKEWHDRLRGETEGEIRADAELLAGTVAKTPIHTQTDAGKGTNNAAPTPVKSDLEIREEANRTGVRFEDLKAVYEAQQRR